MKNQLAQHVKFKLTLCVCFLYFGVALTFGASNYYVNNNSATGDVYTSAIGNNANNGTSGATPKLSLSNVLSTYAAVFVSGDTIFIDAGNYSDFDLSSPINGVVIMGVSAAKTIFTNPGTDNYFMRINDNNTVLAKMALVDYDDQGGGVGQALGIVANIIGVNVNSVLVSAGSQTSSLSGYPIEVASGANVTFNGGGSTCNNWDAGGGIHIQGATTKASIYNYTFVGNSQIFYEGTALRVDNGTVNVRNSLFENNAADGDHRAAAMYVAGGTVNVYDCTFNANSTRLSNNSIGGSILISGGTVRIARCLISNHTQTGGSTSYGAGIGVTAGTATIDSCYFFGNSGSTTRGTDLYNNGGTVLARYCVFGSAASQIGSNAGTLTISNSGNPSSNASYRTGLTVSNTTVSTYTANPTTAAYSGSCAAGITLPVELLDFQVNCESEFVQLSWTTASERDNAYFTVEKANDPAYFEFFKNIQAAGNSANSLNYQLMDENKQFGTVYYRLSQTDFNGKKKILKTVAFQKQCTGTEIEAHFDPTTNAVKVYAAYKAHQKYVLKVVDALGQLVGETEFTVTAEQTESALKLNQVVQAAVYFVVLETATTTQTVKMLAY